MRKLLKLAFVKLRFKSFSKGSPLRINERSELIHNSMRELLKLAFVKLRFKSFSKGSPLRINEHSELILNNMKKCSIRSCPY